MHAPPDRLRSLSRTLTRRGARATESLLGNPSLMRRFGVTVCRIEYAGRRSGRPVTLTAWCHPVDGGARIDVGMAGRKVWWRNFRGAGHPLRLTVDGVTRSGTGLAVEESSGKVHVDVTYDG